MGKSMVSLVNSHTNATRIGWNLWEIDLRFALNSNPGWNKVSLVTLAGDAAGGREAEAGPDGVYEPTHVYEP